MQKSNLSPKVKELLNTISWDYTKGTINSKELLNQISTDKTLNLLIKAHNLDHIKHSEVAVDDLLKNAFSEAGDFNSTLVETTHLLISLLKTLKSKKYKQVKVQIKEILGMATKINAKVDQKRKEASNDTPADDDLLLVKMGVVRDLTKLAQEKKLKKVVSRTKIEDKLIKIVSRKYKSSCMLLGSKGSGRTSLMISLANRIVEKNVPKYLQNASVISINLPAMINSFEFRDKFETGFKQLIEHKSKSNTFTLFFFDDLHLLTSSGLFGFSPPLNEQFIDISSSKNKDYENINKIPNIAFIATMNADYNDRFFEGPLHDMWELLHISNPSSRELKQILKSKKIEFESYYGVILKDKAFEYLLNQIDPIFNQFEGSKLEFSVGLLDDLFAGFISKYSHSMKSNNALVKDEKQTNHQHSVSDKNLMASDVIEYNSTSKELKNRITTQIPTTYVKEYLSKEYSYNENTTNIIPFDILLDLDAKLNNEIIGQKSAIRSLVNSIKRSSLGFGDKNKPLSSMLFLGPTGVGKTQTAKSLSKYLFGAKKIIRIDMSDFMEKHTVSRLVGSPPGYVGYGEGGELTDFVSKNPRCIVLFDEIEKAHPDVLNILLQILEEGQLTSGDRVTVNFNQTVVILTSNLGAHLIQQQTIGFINNGFSILNQNIKDNLLQNLKKEIKPEILNRLSDVVVFRMLSEKNAYTIVKNEVSMFVKQVKKLYNINMSVDDSVLQLLLKKGYSKEYGAREIKRSVNKNLIDLVVATLVKNPSRKRLKATVSNNKILVK